MKTLLINMLLMISLVASAPLLAQEDPLKVGMSGQYFPFTFVEQDKLKGFDVDVMKAIGKELGREIQFETRSPSPKNAKKPIFSASPMCMTAPRW